MTGEVLTQTVPLNMEVKQTIQRSSVEFLMLDQTIKFTMFSGLNEYIAPIIKIIITLKVKTLLVRRRAVKFIFTTLIKKQIIFAKKVKMTEVDQQLDFMETTPMSSQEVASKDNITEKELKEVVMNFMENLTEETNKQKQSDLNFFLITKNHH